MQMLKDSATGISPKVPWNKGKLLGAKPPLKSKQVWAIVALARRLAVILHRI